MEGTKESEDGERGWGWGRLFEGSDYFKYFRLKGRLFEGGDLSRDGYYSRKYGKWRHDFIEVGK